MLVRLFRKAGSTGHVFLFKGGRARDKGLAYSGVIGPMTTVAVVPSLDYSCQLSLGVQTSDNQVITISGDVTIRFRPEVAIKAFDFTVDVKTGGYVNNWQSLLQAAVTERVFAPLRERAKTLKVGEAINAHTQLEDAVAKALATDTAVGALLSQKGVEFVSCSVADVAPEDEDVASAMGALEREAMLTEADAARHERRMSGSRNERKVKTYEAQTALGLEKERSRLVNEQGANEEAKAAFDAKAAKKRLEPFAEVAPEVVLVASLMEMGKRGVGSLTISPELIGVLNALKAR